MAKSQKSTAKKVVHRIQLTVPAKEMLAAISDKCGITQLRLSSNIIEWFAMQPVEIQAVILEIYPESLRKEVASILLDRKK